MLPLRLPGCQLAAPACLCLALLGISGRQTLVPHGSPTPKRWAAGPQGTLPHTQQAIHSPVSWRTSTLQTSRLVRPEADYSEAKCHPGSGWERQKLRMSRMEAPKVGGERQERRESLQPLACASELDFVEEVAGNSMCQPRLEPR